MLKSFFKRSGIGLLTVLGLPFFLAILLLGLVYTIITWIIMFFWAIRRFFSGKKVFGPTERDIQAARILKRRLQKEQDELDAPKGPQQTLNIQNAIFYQGPQANIPQDFAQHQALDSQDEPQYIEENETSGYITTSEQDEHEIIDPNDFVESEVYSNEDEIDLYNDEDDGGFSSDN